MIRSQLKLNNPPINPYIDNDILSEKVLEKAAVTLPENVKNTTEKEMTPFTTNKNDSPETKNSSAVVTDSESKGFVLLFFKFL